MIKFIPARALRENEEIAAPGIEARAIDPIRKESELSARAAWLTDEMHLIGIAETSQDEHALFRRVPVEERGCPAFGITADLFGDLRRNRGNAIEHEAIGRSKIVSREKGREEK